MRMRRLAGRLGLVVAAGLLLVAVALVAAQGEGPRSPNEGAALEQTTGSSDLPSGIAPEEMVGRSPEDFAATPAGSDLPEGISVMEMAGRSPEGDMVGAEPAAAVATDSAAATDGTGFLLTAVLAPGAAADTSCPTGYRMASLYEIADVTKLDYVRIPGQVTVSADHVEGPPAGITGWVRTGFDSDNGTTAGHANCNLWTTSTSGYGTLVKLNDHWTASAQAVSPWQASVWGCSGIARVWCIED